MTDPADKPEPLALEPPLQTGHIADTFIVPCIPRAVPDYTGPPLPAPEVLTEYMRGCSNLGPGDPPWKCDECTRVFLDVLRRRLAPPAWQPDPPECEWFWAVERYRAEDDPPVACVRRVAGDHGGPDGFTATDGNATHGSWFFDEDHLRLHFGPFLPIDPPEPPTTPPAAESPPASTPDRSTRTDQS